NMRNNNIMLYKNLPQDRLFKVFIARMFLDGIAAIKFLFDGGFKDLYAVVKAHWKFFSLLPELREERKKIQHFPVSKVYQRNLVYVYFLKGKRKFSDLSQNKFS
ncbi:MAG: glycosyltransferase family 2 protein, partial [Bacteroidales bacterium]|nr:glycosyltransferase family 2 protein [Bacteroidales bacterium]